MSQRRWIPIVRKWGAALVLTAMVVGGIGITTVVLFGSNLLDPDTAEQSAAPSTPVTPPAKMPVPHEFAIEVVVTEQNCPPAGDCVYTYSIEPQYIGLHPLPEEPFTVQYQVTGGREPQDGSFSVHGSEARIFKDVTLEGPAGAQLSATATQVVPKPVFGPPITTEATQTAQPLE